MDNQLPRLFWLQPVDGAHRRHADLAMHLLWAGFIPPAGILLLHRREVTVNIPLAVIGKRVLLRNITEMDPMLVVDEPRLALFPPGDVMDKTDSLGVVRPDGRDQPGVRVTKPRQADFTDRQIVFADDLHRS